jgi:epoxyqueuosine reductase
MTSTLRSPHQRGPVRRRLHRVGNLLAHRISPQTGWFVGSQARLDRLSRVPVIPVRFIRKLRTPATAWDTPTAPLPPELRTVAGIRRNPAAEDAAFTQHPLHDFFTLHAEAFPTVYQHMSPTLVSVGPRLLSATRRLRQFQNRQPHVPPDPRADPVALTRELKAEARRLGISAAGVAPYDPKYTFAEFAGLAVGDRVVVCVLEQNYDSTQSAPSMTSERAALSTYSELEDRLVELSAWLRRRGYQARPEIFDGESVVIHYGVAAGLGQLGMNGQLLTPQAGSRCRLNMLTTDAPLVFDEPIDYGIERICDSCQICVRRCPVGAIPNQRKEFRGITKPKLNTKRCLPILMQTEGCAICMKVCPVQRFGLAPVIDEYQRNGTILGKNTDDLEGYDWPLDGQHYGPSDKPKLPLHVTSPKGLNFDPARIEPGDALSPPQHGAGGALGAV